MTRKDYVAIAAALKDAGKNFGANDTDARVALTHAACNIADVMSDDNPRFNREKFYVACGVKYGTMTPNARGE